MRIFPAPLQSSCELRRTVIGLLHTRRLGSSLSFSLFNGRLFFFFFVNLLSSPIFFSDSYLRVILRIVSLPFLFFRLSRPLPLFFLFQKIV